MTAAGRWRELQEQRGIPPEIVARAPESPWKHDPKHFGAPEQAHDTPSRDAALAVLDGAGGAVLDVGCGGGSASLAVAGSADLLVGVDHNPGMLEVFSADCTARGVTFRTVLGEWPAVAGEAGSADAVLCHHVGYNTVDFPPFLLALTEAARRGVVMELTARHPMAWLDPLWLRFHGLRRAEPATADDAVAVLVELGITPTVVRWRRPARLPEDPEWVARRLCLPPQRVGEVAAALAEIPPRARDTVTLSW
ncbi:class I SAM-dependent methyltransferase [Pseudonocardia acaciae]|uniref:class I SAM-dependent methyltransferase n=1 Tax=Pseudonocardia acaciae TaxID=551276 RepID=UPI00055FDE8A|nr:class I SAM-dependent methyltransferase [Pseudonocardia acaciae]